MLFFSAPSANSFTFKFESGLVFVIVSQSEAARSFVIDAMLPAARPL